MANLKASVAYLQGLTAGLEMPGDSKEAKLLGGIVEALAEFADAVEVLDDSQERLEDYLESIDEDLYGLENDLYPDEDENDDEDIRYLDVECPECVESVGPDYGLADEGFVSQINCPHCEGAIRIGGNNNGQMGIRRGHEDAF